MTTRLILTSRTVPRWRLRRYLRIERTGAQAKDRVARRLLPRFLPRPLYRRSRLSVPTVRLSLAWRHFDFLRFPCEWFRFFPKAGMTGAEIWIHQQGYQYHSLQLERTSALSIRSVVFGCLVFAKHQLSSSLRHGKEVYMRVLRWLDQGAS
jgi:hypothetical protein